MKSFLKILPGIFIFSLLIFIPLALLIYFLPVNLVITDLVITESVFFIITLFSILVFIAGAGNSDEGKPLFTLTALGLKFFLSIIFALVYFIALKNTQIQFIILFFLLYLAFTIHLLRVILKILKIKSLKKGQT